MADLTTQAGTSSDRRSFLKVFSWTAMAGGLAAAYGGLAVIALRFLYPARPQRKGWMFVTDVASMPEGRSINYRTPAGEHVSITRLDDAGDVGDFVALSTICPHLGCHTHWESQNQRFFCPCHNGAFDKTGKPIAGPPKDANQPLPRYPLRIEEGLLFIEVAIGGISVEDRAG